MKINRHVVIQNIVEKRRSFYTFLDHINRNLGSLDFPKLLYLKFYEEIVNDKQTDLINIFALQTMLDTGIFTRDDRHSGDLSMSKVIVDLLRFLDISRNKELSHAQLEVLRKSIVDITAEIQIRDIGTYEYDASVAVFKGLLDEILTVIQENVLVLESKVDDISELYRQREKGIAVISLNDLYRKVDDLYHHHIKPCLEFIDSSVQISGSMTFTQALDGLIEHSTRNNRETFAIATLYKKTAITTFYKDIVKLSERVRNYLSNLEADRRNFLAIENAFNRLMQDIDSLRHGRVKNRFLSPQAPVFSDLNSLDGLSEHKQKYSARFNRVPEKQLQRFRYFLEELTAQPVISHKIKLTALPAEEYPETDRQIMIDELMAKIAIPPMIEDIERFIFDNLIHALPDFKLSDVLYGFEILLPQLGDAYITPQRKRAQLEHDLYYLSYPVWQYSENQHG